MPYGCASARRGRGTNMLNDQEFSDYCRSISLTGEALEYVERVRTGNPSRMVGARAISNVIGFVPSAKMGFSVSAESRMPERAFITLCEYDHRILEFWDQPDPIRIQIKDKKDRLRSIWYTPDYLVLTLSGVRAVEVKDEISCSELCARGSYNWRKCGERYEYYPAKKAFSEVGVQHEVFVYRHETKYKISNIESILSARQSPRYDSSGAEKVKRYLSENVWMSLYDLKEAVGLESFCELVQMIDDGVMIGDLDGSLISSPRGFLVSLQDAYLEQGIKVLKERRPFSTAENVSIDMGLAPSAGRAKQALSRLERIDSGEKSRSTRRWITQIQEGEKLGLTRFQSLLPEYHKSGNRKNKAPDYVLRFLDDYLRSEHCAKRGLSEYRSYIAYKSLARQRHPNVAPVSRTTFRKYLAMVPGDYIGYQRGGRRMSNAMSSATPVLYRGLKTSYAWRTAAVDHYYADIYIVIFNGGDYVFAARPTITGIIDLYSGAVLALSLSLLPPSRKTIAKALRDCVRRHGKLPSELIVDRGAEFKSVYFASLLADLGITLSLRPSAHPRFGGEIEGLFGDFKKMWLVNRPGNTADYKEVRSVDRKFSPERDAVLRPYDFYRELVAFMDWRTAKPVSPGGGSPIYLLNQGQRDFPYIAKKVSIDQEFLIATSVDSKRYKFDPIRGIHIGEMHYWSPELALLGGKNARVEVRPDAENPHLVYAGVNNHWVSCQSARIHEYLTLDPIGQHVHALEVIDALKDKRAIKEQADESLVAIIREMDSLAEHSEIPALTIAPQIEAGSDQDIFSRIRNSRVEPLAVEAWRDQR